MPPLKPVAPSIDLSIDPSLTPEDVRVPMRIAKAIMLGLNGKLGAAQAKELINALESLVATARHCSWTRCSRCWRTNDAPELSDLNVIWHISTYFITHYDKLSFNEPSEEQGYGILDFLDLYVRFQKIFHRRVSEGELPLPGYTSGILLVDPPGPGADMCNLLFRREGSLEGFDAPVQDS